MPGKDWTRWQQVEGDHADDPAYDRIALDPNDQPTDEANTAAEAEGGVNATAGAITAANDLGVDLSTVEGTGTNGRITKADVEAAAG